MDEEKVNMIKRIFCSKPKQKSYSEFHNYFVEVQQPPNELIRILDPARQPNLNWKMRALLIDWMMEVSSEFGLHRETFYLSINYLDRYVSTINNIEKRNYQLIGTTALYVACKIEEIFTPKLQFFVLATDNGYTRQQILEMERKLAMDLEWKLTPPSIETWIRLCLLKWDEFCKTHRKYNLQHMQFLEIFSIINEHLVDNGTRLPNEMSVIYYLSNHPAYKRYREVTQLIDTVILDVDYVEHKPQALIFAAVF